MVFQRTIKGGTHTLHRLLSGQGAVGFGNATLAMGPLGFNRIEPGALDGQGANQEPDPFARALDELVRLAYPLTNCFADMPGGIIPNDDQHRFAQRLSFGTAPRQELKGEGTHRALLNEAPPHLLLGLSVIGPEARQQPVAGQRFAIRVIALFDLLPTVQHDLTPIPELTVELPSGARVYADKGYIDLKGTASILRETGVQLIAIRRKNMRPLDWADDYELRQYRRRIETMNSQLESMGLERLHARTNSGFEIQAHSSLLALAFKNLI